MDKRKRRKIVIVTACIVLLLGVFAVVEYNKYREKPLLQVIPISQDEVADIRLSYLHGDDVKLDAQQTAELWDILDNCTVKFWSSSHLSNHYADVWLNADTLPTGRPSKDTIISLSSDGRIMAYRLVTSFPKYRPVYRFVTGEEEVYQFLYAVREAGVIC